MFENTVETFNFRGREIPEVVTVKTTRFSEVAERNNLEYLGPELTDNPHWTGHIKKADQLALLGAYFGKGRLTFFFNTFELVYSVKVCFGQDFDNAVIKIDKNS